MSEFGFYIRKGWPLLFIILAVAGAFYLNSSVTEDIDNRTDLAQARLTELKSEIARIQKRVGDYNESRAAIKQYSDYLYTKQDPQKLIDRMESDASSFNVRLSDIQIDLPRFFRDRENPETVILIKYRAVFVGDYYDLGEFLKVLEKRPYTDDIEKLATALKTPDGNKLEMTVSGTFRVFDGKILEWCLNDGT